MRGNVQRALKFVSLMGASVLRLHMFQLRNFTVRACFSFWLTVTWSALFYLMFVV